MLEVLPTPDGINYDHADWAEAQIEMNSGKPLAVPDCELIEIPTRNLQLVVRVDKNKNVFQQYFGERGGLEKIFSAGVPMTPLYPTFFSCRDYTYRTEPALHVIHADGHMNTVLKIRKYKNNTTRYRNYPHPYHPQRPQLRLPGRCLFPGV